MAEEPTSRGETASFLLRAIVGQRVSASLFARLTGMMPEISPLYFWMQTYGPDDSRLLILDENGISYAEAARIPELLPDPGPEWSVVVAEGA
jgi:hypothetical protein